MSGWVAGAVVVAGVGGALISANAQENASEDAAAAQTHAADQSIAESQRQYDLTRADNEPYRQAGTQALSSLQSMSGTNDKPFTLADFQQDPGYQFRLAEGEKAINRSLAAKGGALSGRGVLEGERYASGLASQEYGAAYDRFNNDKTGRFNRLASLAGVGQTANASNQQAGQFNAQSNISSLSNMGNANAASAIAGGNATSRIVGSTVGGIQDYAMAYQQHQQNQQLLAQLGRG